MGRVEGPARCGAGPSTETNELDLQGAEDPEHAHLVEDLEAGDDGAAVGEGLEDLVDTAEARKDAEVGDEVSHAFRRQDTLLTGQGTAEEVADDGHAVTEQIGAEQVAADNAADDAADDAEQVTAEETAAEEAAAEEATTEEVRSGKCQALHGRGVVGATAVEEAGVGSGSNRRKPEREGRRDDRGATRRFVHGETPWGESAARNAQQI
jgi:hypothetical protein